MKAARSSKSRRSAPVTAKEAWVTANAFCLRQFGTSFSGDSPHRLLSAAADLWIVPIVFTSPGYGLVGQVGVIAVNPHSGEIVASSPKTAVLTNGKRLAEDKKDDLRAALLRARAN